MEKLVNIEDYRKPTLDDSVAEDIKCIPLKFRTAPEGMARIIELDRYTGKYKVHEDCSSNLDAKSKAEVMTMNRRNIAFFFFPQVTYFYDLATVYHAYNDKGEYLGGDVWNTILNL